MTEKDIETAGRDVRNSDHELKQNRTLMTILHFILTYPRWSLSLFLLLASRSLPLPVPRESVRQPLLDLQSVTRYESELFYECTADTYNKVQVELNATALRQQEYIQEEITTNQMLVQAADRTARNAQSASLLIRRTLQTWQTQAPIPFNQDANMCSEGDLVNLTQLLTSDPVEVGRVVDNAVDEYMVSSSAALRHMSDYARRRAIYDYDYFVGVKIHATVQFLDNINSPEIVLSLGDTDILRQIQELIRAIKEALENAYIRVSLLTARLDEFHASIQAFYVNYLDIYQRLLRASLWVEDFLPGTKLPSFLILDGIPQAKFLLPSVFLIPSFDVALPDINTMIAEYAKELLKLLADLVVMMAREASYQSQRAVEALMDVLRELMTLEDYDPPRYEEIAGRSFDEDNQLLLDKGEEAKLVLREALAGKVPLGFDQQYGQSVLTNEPFNTSKFDGSSTAFFTYLEPSFPSLHIPMLLETLFQFLVANQWAIEMIVQLVRLWRLRKKYERNALPDLPQVEYNSYEEDEDEDSTSNQQGNAALLQLALMKHLMTPWMALGLIAFPLCVAIVSLWFPYVHMKCFDSKDGTFVAHNILAPVLINRANIAGYNLHVMADLECRKTQRRLCEELHTGYGKFYRADKLALQSLRRQWDDAWNVTNLVRRCVQVDWMDNDMSVACCGLEGYDFYQCASDQQTTLCPINHKGVDPPSSFRPIGDYMDDQSLVPGLQPWNIGEAELECESFMNICDNVSSCGGVDTSLIRHYSVEADCRVEAYVILCCIFVLLALYNAIMCNLCSTLFFNGVKRILWRKLRPEGIQFTTFMTEDGQLVYGGDPNERSAKVRRAMSQFELVGRIQCALSIVLFLLWLISFFVVRRVLRDFTDYV